MSNSESKSHVTSSRLEQQEKLNKEAASALTDAIQMNMLMSSKNMDKSHLGPIFYNLKKKIDIVKMRSRKIKSLIDESNISSEMCRLFEILKDNFRTIYLNQKRFSRTVRKL